MTGLLIVEPSQEDLTFDGQVSVRQSRTTVIISDPDPLLDDVDGELDLEVFPDEEVAQEVPPAQAYQDWLPEQTKVVTYTTHQAVYPKDKPTKSLAAARAEVEVIHGRILETNMVPGRFFFRVYKVRQ